MKRKQALSGKKSAEVIRLRELRTQLNRQVGYEKYHIDHIVPLCMGGIDVEDNIWIVPAEWNVNTMQVRPISMIVFIQSWVLDNGRLCTQIPQELKDLELQEIMKEWKILLKK